MFLDRYLQPELHRRPGHDASFGAIRGQVRLGCCNRRRFALGGATKRRPSGSSVSSVSSCSLFSAPPRLRCEIRGVASSFVSFVLTLRVLCVALFCPNKNPFLS